MVELTSWTPVALVVFAFAAATYADRVADRRQGRKKV